MGVLDYLRAERARQIEEMESGEATERPLRPKRRKPSKDRSRPSKQRPRKERITFSQHAREAMARRKVHPWEIYAFRRSGEMRAQDGGRIAFHATSRAIEWASERDRVALSRHAGAFIVLAGSTLVTVVDFGGDSRSPRAR